MNLIVVFLQKAIAQGIAILYGANGEIVTEKSGNLNLGVPGMMYMGGVAGLMGAFLYENSVEAPVPFVRTGAAALRRIILSAVFSCTCRIRLLTDNQRNLYLFFLS